MVYGLDAADRDYELAVYDLEGLRLRRTMPVPDTGDHGPRELECTDPSGEVLRVRLGGNEDAQSSQLVLRGSNLAEEIDTPQRLLHDDGTRVIEMDRDDPRASTELSNPLQFLQGVVPAEDGRTAAGQTCGTSDGDVRSNPTARVVVFDRQTGEVRARWNPGVHVTQLAWSGSGDLVARIGNASHYSAPRRLGEVVRLDRDLRVLARAPGVPGGSMAIVGDQTVFYGGARIGATLAGGQTLVVEDLRLAATHALIPLATTGFAPDRPPATEPLPVAVRAHSTDQTAVGVLAGLALAAVGAAAFGVRWVRASR